MFRFRSQRVAVRELEATQGKLRTRRLHIDLPADGDDMNYEQRSTDTFVFLQEMSCNMDEHAMQRQGNVVHKAKLAMYTRSPQAQQVSFSLTHTRGKPFAKLGGLQ